MKKVFTVFLLSLIVLGLTGCSSIQIGYTGSDTFGKMSASYYSFSGTKEGKITVKDGEAIDVSVDIVTKKGIIDLYIFKDEDSYEYEGNNIKTSDFTVTLSDPGEYTVKIDTQKHRGSYKIKWSS